MTTHKKFSDRNRDAQDVLERHIYGEIEDVEGGGRIIKVKGTGRTEDEEAIVLAMFGMGGKFPKDTNAEVILFSGNSDTCLKFAMVLNPHDKERKWKEKTNGLQYYDDPNRAVEINPDRTHLTDKNVAIGKEGTIEVKDDNVTIRGNLTISGEVRINGQLYAPVTNTTVSPAPSAPNVIPPFQNENGTPNDASSNEGVPTS